MKRQVIKNVAVLFMAAAAALAAPSAAQAAGLSVKSCVLSKGDCIDIDVKGAKETKGTYKSSDKRVASVSKKGIVKAKREGAAQIVWKQGKTKYRVGLIVVKAPKLGQSNLLVKEGKSKKVSLSQFGNSSLTATWSSGDEKIAVVRNGKITGVSEGSTLVTVQIKGKKKIYKRYVAVTVKKNMASTVTAADTLPDNAADDHAGNAGGSAGSNLVIPPASTGTSEATGASVAAGTSAVTGASVAEGTSVATGTSVTTGTSVVTGTSVAAGTSAATGTSVSAGTSAATGTSITTGTSVSTGTSVMPGMTGVPGSESTVTGSQISTSNGTQAQATGSAVKPGENASGESSGNVNPGSTAGENTSQGNTNSGTNPAEKPAEKSMAEQVAELVNKERAAQGLLPLSLDEKLTACADIRAEELQDVFSHTRPDGTKCYTVLDDNDISYFSCGENIASGQKTAEEVMNSWMNSDGHRSNILGAGFSKIGVGYSNFAGKVYWVQLFTG